VLSVEPRANILKIDLKMPNKKLQPAISKRRDMFRDIPRFFNRKDLELPQ